MNKDEEIRKNLNDIEYNKYLNYLVMSIIIIATFIITTWFSAAKLIFKLVAIAISVALGMITWFLINVKLNQIKENIKKI